MAYGEENPTLRLRARIVYWSTAAAAVFYALVLWNLQILRVEEFRRSSERNAVKSSPVKAGRGLIRDRDGTILARNRRSFDLLVDTEDLDEEDRETTLAALEALVGADREALTEEIRHARRAERPVLAAEDVDFHTVAWAEAHRLEYPHLRVRPAHRREYPWRTLGAHLLGYIGEITQRELDQPDLDRRRRGDLVGRSGLEEYYDRVLSGTHGRRLSVVDAMGREVETWIDEEPVVGSTIHLTVDLELQQAAEEAMGDHAGSAVVLDPRNGAVLALVSRPAFDPNLFSRRLTRQEWKLLNEAPRDPLLNRSAISRFSPGSTFKILMAIAGLEEGLLTPDTKHHCVGGTRVHGQWRRCWKPGGHGTVDLRQAIQGSCNVYFYKVGEKLGIERIARWARAFGFGSPSGLDLPSETRGTVPDPAWKRENYQEPWWPGETISVAIGQGALEVTPVQQAVFAAAVANGGGVYRPYLLERVEDPARPERRMEAQPALVRRLMLHDETLDVVHQGMWMVVNEFGGTARSARVKQADVCGKTGTAQVHRGSAGTDNEDMEYELRDHAWFIGFAPRDEPRLAWAVFIEHGGHGGDTAAPVARNVVETWLEQRDLVPAEAVALRMPALPTGGRD